MKKKCLICFLVLVVAAVSCLAAANNLQHDKGNITIEQGFIETEPGSKMFYKLYIPKDASAANPAPGVLLLHGYQNDHETCAAYAIELARRGIVVMAVDEYGHGWTDVGLLNRGFVNHKVTVNYGEDSEADGTFTEIGGADRYKLMMNFSNLSFFDDKYTKGSDGSVLTDSSCGGILVYPYLAHLPYVDSTKLGVSGHSMGTWSSWSVAAAYSGTDIEPKATVLQCGELFTSDCYDEGKYHFNNVLLLQAKYDEFSYFRDYKNVVNDDLMKSALRTEFLGTTADKAEFNKIYGSFGDGSARAVKLLITNHRLTTHNKEGLAFALNWFCESFGWDPDLTDWNDQIAMTKEWLVFFATILTVFSLMPLAGMLLAKPFEGLVQPLPPKRGIKTKKKWWGGAMLTIALAGATYPFMTQLGHGLLPLPEKVFRMTIGNGFLSYYGLLIIIMLIMTCVGLKKSKKNEESDRFYQIGLGSKSEPDKFSWKLFGKGALLAAILMAYMYIMVVIAEKCFMLDLRFIWPFFKSFTGERFVQFLVYILIYAAFFILNNSKAIAVLRTESTYKEGFGGFMSCWIKNAFIMTGGVLLIALIEYIPFFAEIGPGADLLFSSTFGGPFMSLLIVFMPQVLLFSVVSTYLYRKSGSVFAGGIISAMLACWVVTGGSSML